MDSLAPIILFVYNRPSKTRQALEALANNTQAKDSVLYIFADGAKDDATEDSLKEIEDTRAVLKQKQWCKEVHIIESEKNKGLAKSIVEGVSQVINQHGKAIVLEDDIVTSPGFLQYMNDALNLYKDEEKVMHISGFVPVTTGAERLPETYFLRFMSCWGWATWKRAWDNLITDTDYLYKILPAQPDFDEYNLNGALNLFSQIEDNYNGSLKTWAIKWYSTIFLNKGLCLYPNYSLVDNIGLDGSGQNSISFDNSYKVDLAQHINVAKMPLEENAYAKEYLRRFYIYGRDSSWTKRMIFDFRQSNFTKYIKSTSLYRLYSKTKFK